MRSALLPIGEAVTYGPSSLTLSPSIDACSGPTLKLVGSGVNAPSDRVEFVRAMRELAAIGFGRRMIAQFLGLSESYTKRCMEAYGVKRNPLDAVVMFWPLLPINLQDRVLQVRARRKKRTNACAVVPLQRKDAAPTVAREPPTIKD